MSHDADCSEVLRRVFEYLDHEMGQADAARITAHLDDCGECMSAYQRDRLVKALVARSCACEAAPETLRLSIMTRITTVHVDYDERRVTYQESVSYDER